MKYGAILRACRERAGFNQEEMAFRLNVNQSDVSKYENNAKEPPMSVFQDWAMATQTQEVLVAFLVGIDGLTMLTDILSTVATSVVGLVSFLF